MERELKVTRKTISVFLQTENPDAYKAEKERRKKETEERTKKIKKTWADENSEKVLQCQINCQAKKLGITPEAYEIYLFQRPTLKDELR
ncbi:hypothetical protein SDC9_174389 [bioreactor metagenome]|uniref:Uncharacterized protein n=1 Tax=bioreactor metagenome TaxID=1076179 RepID=A0A645GTJ6_9ZZZZ